MTIIIELEEYGMTREIWSYLTTKDIINLYPVNKEIHSMSKRINILVPQKIEFCPINLDFFNDTLNPDEIERKFINQMLSCFPNILKLKILQNTNNKDRYNNSFFGESISFLYESPLLRKNLKELSVSIVSDDGLIGISELKNLTSLDISNIDVDRDFCLTSDGFSHLSSLTNITSLNLSRSAGDDNIDLSFLANLTKINTLQLINFSPYEYSNESLIYLSNLRNLTYLDLSENTSSISRGLSHITSLTNISFLKLSECNLLDPLPYLSSLINLTFLDLSFSPIGNIESSLSTLTKMKSLYLNDCCLVDNAFESLSLSSLVNLTLLEMKWNFDFYGQGLSHFSKFTNLISLNLSGCSLVDNHLNNISTLTSIKTLDLSEIFSTTNMSFLAEKFMNINELSISWDINKEETLINNIFQLPNLKILRIITIVNNHHDYGVKELSEYNINKLLNLELFEILNNTFITEEGVKGMAYAYNTWKNNHNCL